MKFLLLLVGLVAFLMLLAMPCAMKGPCQTDSLCSAPILTVWLDAMMLERNPMPVLGGAGKVPDPALASYMASMHYDSDPNTATAPPFARRL